MINSIRVFIHHKTRQSWIILPVPGTIETFSVVNDNLDVFLVFRDTWFREGIKRQCMLTLINEGLIELKTNKLTLASGLPYSLQSTNNLNGSLAMDTTKEKKLRNWRRQRDNDEQLRPIVLADMFLDLLRIKYFFLNL